MRAVDDFDESIALRSPPPEAVAYQLRVMTKTNEQQLHSNSTDSHPFHRRKYCLAFTARIDDQLEYCHSREVDPVVLDLDRGAARAEVPLLADNRSTSLLSLRRPPESIFLRARDGLLQNCYQSIWRTTGHCD